MASLGLVTAAGAVNWGGVAGLVSVVSGVGTAVYSAGQDAPDVSTAPQILDKSIEQKAEALEAPEIGDEASRKRKQQAAKSKFKQAQIIPKDTTGVNITGSDTAPGVQI